MQMEDNKVNSNDLKERVARYCAKGYTDDKKIDNMLETYKAGYMPELKSAEKKIPEALKPYISQSNK